MVQEACASAISVSSCSSLGRSNALRSCRYNLDKRPRESKSRGRRDIESWMIGLARMIPLDCKNAAGLCRETSATQFGLALGHSALGEPAPFMLRMHMIPPRHDRDPRIRRAYTVGLQCVGDRLSRRVACSPSLGALGHTLGFCVDRARHSKSRNELMFVCPLG